MSINGGNLLLRIKLVEKRQGNIIHKFANSENRSSQQQSKKSSNFTEKTQKLERDVLFYFLVAYFLIENVQLNKVLPEKEIISHNCVLKYKTNDGEYI